MSATTGTLKISYPPLDPTRKGVCPSCNSTQKYLAKPYSTTVECNRCGQPFTLKGTDAITPRPGMRYTKCPSCNNTQAYTITLEARNIRCHNCSHTWQVPGKSSLGKLSKAQCPECGRTYEYNLIRPSRCPGCKAPLMGKKMDLGKQGRCESIW